MPDRVYDARAVANYLIAKAAPRGLDPLQVMKLTYIAHGFTLGLTSRPLLEDDVEAWKFGPVVRRLYKNLPGGSAPIMEPIVPAIPADLQNDERAIVDSVFDLYGHLSGWDLSMLTHRPGSPWEKTWNTYGQNAVIPQDLIREHYKGIMAEFAAAQEAGKPYSPAAL
jgi:uncharacterized phage-associated protein